jgi:hypothetical protein
MSGGASGLENAPTAVKEASYTPVTSNPHTSAFSNQQESQKGISPLVAQQMQMQSQQPAQNIQDMGLQALYQSIQNQFAPISQQFNPMDQFYQQQNRQQGQQQMPTYQSKTSIYRPDMSQVQQNLSRVAPSVVLQQRLAAEEAARLQAEQDAYNAANPAPTYDYSGGSG